MIHGILWGFPTYFNLFYFSESMPQYKKVIKDKGEKDEIKNWVQFAGAS